MNKKVFLTLLAVGLVLSCFGQEKETWKKWNWLIGDWVGVGTGQPGQGEGSFSFTYELEKNILVRKSHSEYPGSENRPKVIHDDLMIVYPDQSGNPTLAIYFDNEGHTINYTIKFLEKSIVMTSNKNTNMTVFRLSYALLENQTVNTKFEMSQDGEKFQVYIEGKSRKRN
jgi:hypothetical protein